MQMQSVSMASLTALHRFGITEATWFSALILNRVQSIFLSLIRAVIRKSPFAFADAWRHLGRLKDIAALGSKINLRHIQPTPVLRGIVKLKFFSDLVYQRLYTRKPNV